MPSHRIRLMLLIAGTLVPAIAASAGPATAQLPPFPTSSTTTTSTTAPASTTTTSTPASTSTSAAEATSTTAPQATTTTMAPEAEGLEEEESLNALTDNGALSVSVPTSAVLATNVPVGTPSVSGQLGAVTVSDQRGGLLGVWTATVSTTNFVTGGGTAAETITGANVRYWSGPVTASSGGTFTPGQLTSLQAVDLSSSRTAFGTLVTAGTSSATWRPTIVVTLPANAVVGSYQGTITHSVA